MAIDPGNSIRAALDLGTLTPQRLKNQVGGSDKFDFYKFRLNRVTNVRASLRGLKVDADMALLNRSGRLIKQNRKPGKQNERIDAILGAGVYYLRLQGRQQATPYTVNLAAKTVVPNAVPTLGGSLVLRALRGSVTPSSTAIASTTLNATDTQQSPNQLTYTITTAPKQGNVFRNGVLLGVGSTFTQADVNNNLISYQQQAIKPLPNSTGITGNVVISGNNAAWIRGTETRAEVFFYNGTTGITTQLTNDTREDANVQISGNTVVWATRFDSTDRDIKYSIDGGAVKTVSSSFADDIEPAISGNYIAFQRNDRSGSGVAGDGVYLFNIATETETQLRSNVENIYGVSVSSTPTGANVVWRRVFGILFDQSNVEYSINGGTYQSVDSSSLNQNPQVSGQYIAFKRSDQSGTNVFGDGVFLVDTSAQTIAQLEGNVEQVYEIRLSGDNVVWERGYGSDSDVRYSIAGGAPRAIDSSPTLNDYNARISGSNIAFEREQVGGNAANGIYLFDSNNPSAAPIRLTTSIASEYVDSIDDHNVGFRSNSQAFFYDGNTTSDSFGFTLSDGALTTDGTLNISIAG